MNALWITLALLTAGFAGWPVTAMVFRLARTIDDRVDAAAGVEPGDGGSSEAGAAVDDAVQPAVRPSGQAAGPNGEPAEPVRDAPQQPGPGAAANARILRGGAIIGILERTAVCLAILAGEPVAIAYVVAIKGLGRFAELKATPVAAERFIIGTLTSMLWAAGVAVLTKVLFLG